MSTNLPKTTVTRPVVVPVPAKDESALRQQVGGSQTKEWMKPDVTAQSGIGMSATTNPVLMPPPILQVGLNFNAPTYTVNEKANLEKLIDFIQEVSTPGLSEQASKRVDPNGQLQSSTWDQTTIGDMVKIHQEIFKLMPDYQLSQIDIGLARDDQVAIHAIFTGSNCGAAFPPLQSATYKKARWTEGIVATFNDAGLIIHLKREYDRNFVRKQLGWPLGVQVGGSETTSQAGTMVTQLTNAAQTNVIDSARNNKTRASDQSKWTAGEKANYQTLQNYFKILFQQGDIRQQSDSVRLAALGKLLSSNESCWVQGFPDFSLLQHVLNCDKALISCAPNMKIEAEGGFAKGNLVQFSFAIRAALTQGRPLGQQPAGSTGTGVCHVFATFNDAHQLVSCTCSWAHGASFQQWGVVWPDFVCTSPYVPLAQRLIARGVNDVDYTPKEQANMVLFNQFLHTFFNADASSANGVGDPQALLSMVESPQTAPWWSTAFQSTPTIGQHVPFVFAQIWPSLRTRSIVQVDYMFAQGDALAAHIQFEYKHDGKTLELPNGVKVNPSGKSATTGVTFFGAVGESGKLTAILEEADFVQAFDQLGWPLEPQAYAPILSNSEIMNKWRSTIALINQASQRNYKPTVGEQKSTQTVQAYISTIFDQSIPFAPPAVANLIAPSDRMKVAGFNVRNCMEMAALSSFMHRMGEGHLLPAPANELVLSRGKHVAMAWAFAGKHNGEAVFGRTVTGKEGCFSASLVGEVDYAGRLVRVLGEWAAAHHFRCTLGIPAPTDMAIASDSTNWGVSIPQPSSHAFHPSEHTEVELQNIRRGYDFLWAAFTAAGPPMPSVIEGRRLMLWQLLGPLINPTQLEVVTGGGWGFADRPKEYLTAWSLEVLPSIPDAFIKEVHSIVARDNTVDFIIKFRASHCGAPFRGVAPTNKVAELLLSFSLTFDQNSRITRITSLGNEERLASALGWPAYASSYGGCFACQFSQGEIRQMPNLKIEVVNRRGGMGALARATFAPGWKWSKDIKPLAKTEWCTHAHYGVFTKGKMNIKLQDGTTHTIQAGQAYYLPPGHDAWCDEECVGYDTLGLPGAYGIDLSKKESTTGSAAVGSVSSSSVHTVEALPFRAASFDQPDETMSFPHGKVSVIKFGPHATIGRFQGEPGWKWSQDVKPIVKTDLCQHKHWGIMTRGFNHVQQSSGAMIDIPASPDHPLAFECEPGHDAWITGNEIAELYDIMPMIQQYAKGGK